MYQNRRRQTPPAPYRHTGRRNVGSPLMSVLFFPVALLYHELLLRVFDGETPFFSMALPRTLFFSLAAGLLLFLILDLLPWRKAARIIGGVVLGIGTVLFCIERGCRNMLGVYYGIGFMDSMAGDVVGGFASLIGKAILGLIPFILLSLVPLVLYIWLRESVFRDDGQENVIRIFLAVVMVLTQLAGVLLSHFGAANNYYTYEFITNSAVPHFGLITSLRLEIQYDIFGQPKPPLDDFLEEPTPLLDPNGDASAEPSSDPVIGPNSEPPSSPPAVYGYNMLDIDFDALAEAADDDTLKSMHQYFGSLTPSQQNEYTGMFQGKNLILLTAEGFCPYAVDEKLTPTLYKLSHEGFVFNNFYQPDWTQSTCGGEFAVTTGVIPNWVSSSYGNLAAQASIEKHMPFTLAKLFAPLGYNVPAWHNGQFDYYKRNQYLTNFGYNYQGCDGGGLELPNNAWPRSDLEMMEATADSYIRDYTENGKPFHAYYMTISGHGLYSWRGNAMSAKHMEEVQAVYPNLSETSQAYLACNMELDQALAYLVKALEDAGIADDTLIVMTGDHYPYLMVTKEGDFYNELRGFEDSENDTSRYRNTLIMWSGAIKEPIVVDTPCSSIDIVPTIANLFGLKYDARLYSGRDIFATNYEPDQYSNCMPLVVFANKGQGNSWITAAGTYEASTRTFTPNEGVTVDEDYVSRVHRLVQGKVNYAKLLVEQDYYQYVSEAG